MTEVRRKPGRPKGTPASAAQKNAGKTNVKKAIAARASQKKARDLARANGAKPRWKQLEDGDISVRDLTDEECVRGEIANIDGGWDGRRHVLAPRMIQSMRTEYKRRFKNRFDELAPLALDAIEDILLDADAPAQRFAAARMLAEYQIGKVPDVVHVGQETEWERMSNSGFVILRGEDNVIVESNDLGEIVTGEVIDDKE